MEQRSGILPTTALVVQIGHLFPLLHWNIPLKKEVIRRAFAVNQSPVYPLSFNSDSSIPDLIKEITHCSLELQSKLGELPPPIEEPRSALHNLCIAFERDLKAWVTGDFDKKDFVVKLGKLDRDFLKNIKFSIAKFGLGDYDEEKEGVIRKCANDFLFEKQRISQVNVD